MDSKRITESITQHVQIIMPEHINGSKRLFGGRLMEWIDVVAGVVARRHSERNVTTAAIDNLEFKEGARINDTIELIGRITWVGRTSMEVCVETFVEALSGERRLINKAYVVMVALGENDRPTAVPGVILETEEEKKEYAQALLRHEARKKRAQL